ncbi:MAG: FIST N-terminal domain-containing protein [Planctomycetota bacterium]
MTTAPAHSFFAAGVSALADPVAAATRAAEQAVRGLAGRRPDLVFLYISGDHVPHAREILTIIHERLHPRHVIGCSAEGVIAGASEIEGKAAVSLLAACLPNVDIHVFTDADLPPIPDKLDDDTLGSIAQGIGARGDLRATFLFVDTFNVPMVRLMPALNAARHTGADALPIGLIAGGLVSGAKSPKDCRLILDDTVRHHGHVGVSLRGGIDIEAIVSQGCRSIGQPFVVTKAKGNVILELGGRSALDAIQDLVQDLPDSDKEKLHNSLLIGRVINEYKDRFGRSDFLIRNIIGVDQKHKAIAVTDIVRAGTTVQFQLRDATTASQDLGMLLDAQQLHDTPSGILLFTCNGRGSRLFSTPHHDARKVATAFDTQRSGEEAAKGGMSIDSPHAPIPMSGFFASGEIGPIGNDSYLHGQTACVVLFRDPHD